MYDTNQLIDANDTNKMRSFPIRMCVFVNAILIRMPYSSRVLNYYSHTGIVVEKSKKKSPTLKCEATVLFQ